MSLEDEIKAFQQQFKQGLKVKPKKTTTTSEKRRKHLHFTQGKTGYVPRPCSNPVRLK